ncbi:hypothetical protein DRN75_00930 [Nanoarchaeota archaeon]|nr:MAG: hypothetical protein DRN75_00930 [Nanoarchaeota archaeon]
MSKIKNTATVNTYGDDSTEEEIIISSHWNRDSFVVLNIGSVKVTVVAADLKRAIDNCTNVGF